MDGRWRYFSLRNASHLQGHLGSPTHVQPGKVVVGAVLFVLLVEHEVIILSRAKSSNRSSLDVVHTPCYKHFHRKRVMMLRAVKTQAAFYRGGPRTEELIFVQHISSFLSRLVCIRDFFAANDNCSCFMNQTHTLPSWSLFHYVARAILLLLLSEVWER